MDIIFVLHDTEIEDTTIMFYVIDRLKGILSRYPSLEDVVIYSNYLIKNNIIIKNFMEWGLDVRPAYIQNNILNLIHTNINPETYIRSLKFVFIYKNEKSFDKLMRTVETYERYNENITIVPIMI